MNSLYSFICFAEQGALYVTPDAGVSSFRLFANNAEVDTSAMRAGSTYKVDISSLTDPIVKFFPNFSVKENIAFKTEFNGHPTTDADKDQIVAWKQQLRICGILMHQAGFDPDPQFHNDQFDQDTQAPEAGVADPLSPYTRPIPAVRAG